MSGAGTRSQQAAIESVNGSPRFVGAVSISGTVATQAVTPGYMYLVQCTVDTYVHGATNSGGTIKKTDNSTTTLTAALGVKAVADSLFIVTPRSDEPYLAFITSGASGTANVFQLEL